MQTDVNTAKTQTIKIKDQKYNVQSRVCGSLISYLICDGDVSEVTVLEGEVEIDYRGSVLLSCL